MLLLRLFGVVLLIPSIFGGFPIERRASTFVIERDTSIDYRLPTNLKPLHYELTLEPFFDPDFTFEGHVIITVQVLADTEFVVFHGRDLVFTEANVQIKEENAVNPFVIKSFNRDDVTELYHIELQESLRALTTITIEINYTGILAANNDGFYRAKYEENGETKWFATTQFEANSARRAFPCFDEPALKATFTIHLIRPENYNSISNMGLESSSLIGTNRYKDTFKKSVLMSTYLVAFIVSEMTAETINNHAVYAPKYLIDDGRGVFSVEASIDILKALEDYTEVDYALDKMFQVAIPDGYFSAGAMENWGLVTYRESRLMYKDGVTTSAEKQSILSIIAHEYAHQWFGNLVSPFWWSYLWLNEGFATYFGSYAVDLVDPSIRMMEQYVVNTVQYAFQSDALETTRAMTVDAQSAREVESLFDRVAYDKCKLLYKVFFLVYWRFVVAGSVLRMMEHFLTTPVYKQGLTNYLRDM
ncbi:LOW QUALITY PROTEIN: aminopeptidase N-like [Onthophagus taurus]|uniref:LOW QUALITY PROTEIN: aminopeptidase N-like n=1 Tax=Onthophagus taurus TaxID=166361 RepID=UPI0039BEAE8C